MFDSFFIHISHILYISFPQYKDISTFRSVRYKNPFARSNRWYDISLRRHLNRPSSDGAEVRQGDILGFAVSGATNPIPFANLPAKVFVINGNDDHVRPAIKEPFLNKQFMIQVHVGKFMSYFSHHFVIKRSIY